MFFDLFVLADLSPVPYTRLGVILSLCNSAYRFQRKELLNSIQAFIFFIKPGSSVYSQGQRKETWVWEVGKWKKLPPNWPYFSLTHHCLPPTQLECPIEIGSSNPQWSPLVPGKKSILFCMAENLFRIWIMLICLYLSVTHPLNVLPPHSLPLIFHSYLPCFHCSNFHCLSLSLIQSTFYVFFSC